jgi:hypothetical protein
MHIVPSAAAAARAIPYSCLLACLRAMQLTQKRDSADPRRQKRWWYRGVRQQKACRIQAGGGQHWAGVIQKGTGRRCTVYNKGGCVVVCMAWYFVLFGGRKWEQQQQHSIGSHAGCKQSREGDPPVWGASLEKEFKQCCRNGGGGGALASWLHRTERRQGGACRAAPAPEQYDKTRRRRLWGVGVHRGAACRVRIRA